MLTLPTYREHRPPESLEPVIACLWKSAPAHDHLQRVVPDGCVNLIRQATAASHDGYRRGSPAE